MRYVDPLIHNNFIDSNILDEIADGENDAVQEIIRVSDSTDIQVLLPYSVCDEVNNPQTPAHVRRVVNYFIYSIEVNLNSYERQNYRDFVDAVSGEAQERNIAPDLFHVWEAAKNGGGYFITRDKRLLGRAPGIADFLGIEVVTPGSFLAKLDEARHKRDARKVRS